MISLIPQVASIRNGDGFFDFSGRIEYAGGIGAAKAASLLAEYLTPAMADAVEVVEVERGREAAPGAIRLAADDDRADGEGDFSSADEEYALKITVESAVLQAPHHVGLLRGIQTLRQLFPAEVYAGSARPQRWMLPVVEIADRPAFRWRGLMLDVSRHFFSVDDVCRFIELAAQHKYNVLHLHLTDDQGWRVEIDAYPELVRTGAFRPCSETVENDHADLSIPPVMDNIPYGGYYTKKDIRKILDFAGRRGITVVPEIDMPGHVQAAIAAYPFLGCTPDNPPGVKTTWRTGKVVLNPNQRSVDFFRNVLKEVMELFPSKVIHVGGDEVIPEQWQNLPEAQRLMSENGLESYRELEYFFMAQIADFIESQGRIPSMWDGGIPIRGTLCTAWLGERGAVIAARLGMTAVNLNCTRFYFDHCQDDPATQPPAFDRKVVQTCQMVYETPIVSEQIANRELIIGAEGAVWTEHIPDLESAEYMTYPRACALAEKLWRPEADCNYDDFIRRLALHRRRLDAQRVNACPTP